jgi:hypothetical protein
MRHLIRAMIFGFIGIAIVSYFFGGQVTQQATMVNYQQEAEKIRTEQEQRNCKQIINSKMCTAPADRFARASCSRMLSDFHCDKYVDVGYLILEEDRQAGNDEPAQ